MGEQGTAKNTHCKNCHGPLGAFSVHCDFCKRAIGGGEQRKRVRRVLFAFDRLLATSHLRAPTIFAANAIGFGLGALTFAALTGIGDRSMLITLAAAATVYFAIGGALGLVVRRMRQAERRIVFERSIRPLLEQFLRDRELDKERFDEIAASSLKRVHTLHGLVPWS